MTEKGQANGSGDQLSMRENESLPLTSVSKKIEKSAIARKQPSWDEHNA